MGDAANMLATLRAANAENPEQLRKVLWSQDWLEVGMRALFTRLESGKRDAVRLYFEALEMVSSKRDTALAIILAEFKLSSIEEGRSLVEVAKRAQATTPDDAYKLAKRICKEKIAANATERELLRQELFGEFELKAEIEVEEAAH